MTATLNELKREAGEDTGLDKARISEHSLLLAKLLAKWNTYLMDERMTYEVINIEFSTKKKEKHEYYLHNYKYVVEKRGGELDVYLNADDELTTIKKRLIISKEKMLFIEGVIKAINSMSFNIRNYIAWEKFMAGEM